MRRLAPYLPDLSRPRNEPLFWIGLAAALFLAGLDAVTDAGLAPGELVEWLAPLLVALIGRTQVYGPETAAELRERNV